MKCLVTGGAGFIGSNLVDQLLKQGYEVVCVDDESAESNEQFYWNDDAHSWKVSITDYDALAKIFERYQPNCIFHLAAESRIQPSIENPTHCFNTNLLGTSNLLKLGMHYGCDRFVLSSTSAVYGLKNNTPFHETMPRQCLNPYSISKAAAEDLCKFYYKVNNFKTIILRYFNVYGPRQPLKGQYAPVIGLFLKQRDANTPLTIIGNGLQTRDFTHVNDVVGANMLGSTTQNEEAYGEAFNVGTGTAHSILDVANSISGKYQFIASRPAELQHARADITKSKKILQWEPKIELEDWINEQQS